MARARARGRAREREREREREDNNKIQHVTDKHVEVAMPQPRENRYNRILGF
jgi:hypothetical protein